MNQLQLQSPAGFFSSLIFTEFVILTCLPWTARAGDVSGCAAKACVPGMPEQTDAAAILLTGVACGNGEHQRQKWWQQGQYGEIRR